RNTARLARTERLTSPLAPGLRCPRRHDAVRQLRLRFSGGRRHRRCAGLVRPRQSGGEQVQLGLAVAELLERTDRRNDIVTVGAGLAVPLANVMKLLLEREPPGVLYVPTIHHVAEPRHPPLGLALEPDRSNGFAVNGRHLLARPQIGDGVVPFFRSHTISDAATGPTAVEAQHQTRPFR